MNRPSSNSTRKKFNSFWGKFERGTLPLSIEEEMSHFVRHDTIKSLFGEIRRRSFASFRTTKIRTVGKGVTFPLCVTPSCLCEGSPPLNGGGLCPLPTPPKDDFKTLGKSWKGGFPLSKKCHSEQTLQEVPSVNGGSSKEVF